LRLRLMLLRTSILSGIGLILILACISVRSALIVAVLPLLLFSLKLASASTDKLIAFHDGSSCRLTYPHFLLISPFSCRCITSADETQSATEEQDLAML